MAELKGSKVEELERTQKELDALRKEYHLLRELFNSNEGGLYLVQDFHIIFNNPHFNKVTGYSDSEIKEMNYLDLIHPKDKKLIKLLFRNDFEEIRQKSSNSFTFRILTKSGEMKWVKSNVSVIRWNEGFAMLDSCYDITMQKEAETKLFEEEQNFRVLVNAFEDFIFIINKKGNIIQTNQSVINHLGFKEHELLLKPFEKLHDNSDLNIGNLIQDAFQNRKCIFPSNLITHKNTRIPVETRFFKGTWSNKEVIFAISQDISERIKAESAIKLSEEKFSKAFNTRAVLMTISTLEGDIYIDVNDAFLRSTGLTQKNVIGRNSKDLGIFEDISQREKLISEITRQKKITDREVIIISKSGKKIICLFSAEVMNIQNQKCMLVVMSDITQRKLIEEELVKSKAQLKGILDNLPFKAWLKDTRGVFLAVNKVFTNHHNLSEEDIIGKTDFDLSPVKQAQKLQRDDLKVIKTRKQFYLEEKVESPAGTDWWETFKAPVLGADSKVLATTGFSRRITELKRSQEEIRNNLDRQKLLTEISYIFNSSDEFDIKLNKAIKLVGVHINVSRVYIFEDSEDGLLTSNTYEWCNRGIHSRIGKAKNVPYSKIPSLKSILKKQGYFISSDISELPTDLNKWFNPHKIIATLIFPLSVAYSHIGFIGFEESTHHKIWSNTDRELLKVVANIIAAGFERKISEDKIRLSELRFRQLSELLPEMIFEANEDRQITFANNYFFQSFNYQPKDLEKGIRIEDLFNGEDKQKVLDILRPEHTNQGQSAIELIARRKNKSTFTTLTHINIVFSNQQSTRYMGVIVDITNRKQQEFELIKAKNLAEEASKAKEQFLSTMSHEIRTPMNAVIGMTNLLLQENPKADQMGNLTALKFSAENLLALLNDILDFSKIEAGKIDILNVPTDLIQIVQGLRNSFDLLAKEKGISLIANVDPGIPRNLLGDPVRINQVLTNLVGNALKFTEKGSVSISLKLKRNYQNSAIVEFFITDTGIGIHQDQQDNIFKEFTQVHTDKTKRYGGTGLGLTISQRLINLLGGQIRVNSKTGEGSTFYYSLRFTKYKEEVKKSGIEPLKEDLVFSKSFRILIVEDNEINKIITEKFLQKWGMEVDHAENGQIAIEKYQAEDFDLILMDLEMPIMSGYDATIHIRNLRDKKKSKIPIIALTASAMQDIQKKIFDLGMNDFILKPFNPQELKKKMIHLLEKSY